MRLYAALVTWYLSQFRGPESIPVRDAAIPSQSGLREGLQLITANWDLNGRTEFTFEWEGHEGPVEINLIRRARSYGSWMRVEQLSSRNNEVSFQWRIPEYLPPGNYYKIEVVDAKGKRDFSPNIELLDRRAVVTTGRVFSASFTNLNPVSATSSVKVTSVTSATFHTPTSSLPSSTTTAPSTSLLSGSSATSAATTGAATDTATSGSGGLTGGAYAGIGVVATLFVVLVAFLAFFLGLRHRRKGPATTEESSPPAEYEAAAERGELKGELHAETKPPPPIYGRPELGGRELVPVVELPDSRSAFYGGDYDNTPAEVQGSTPDLRVNRD